MQKIFNFGINDVKGSSTSRDYKLWVNILNRIHNDGRYNKNPSYRDCSVSEDFILFSNFRKWYNDQVGCDSCGFEIDKDLLSKGNKEYSPLNCILLPREINSALRTRKNFRGCLPIGVSFCKRGKKYFAQLTLHSVHKHLGYFSDANSAFLAYKKIKELAIKELANKWQSQIDPRAYDALMRYEVEITD